MMYETLLDVRPSDLRVGDVPVSLAGFRPISHVQHHPRKRVTIAKVHGVRYELFHSTTIAKVRRPIDSTTNERTTCRRP